MPDTVITDLDDDDETNDLIDDTSSPASAAARRRVRSRRVGRWTRWLHVYISMISLLIVLFFGITGLTLNHPSWTLGGSPTTHTYAGTVPAGFASKGSVDFLAVTEYVRKANGVRGTVAGYQANDTEGTVGFKGPGYAADLVFDLGTGHYTLTVEEQGLLGVLNDLHKGRDTSSSWNWTIDVAAVILVAVAVTGLGIQVLQKRRRRRALTFAAAFTVLSLMLIVRTMR